MNTFLARTVMTAGMAAVIGSSAIDGLSQSSDTPEAHIAAARAAAGNQFLALLERVCPVPAAQPAQPTQRQAVGPPDRAQWHAEPVKVFDNLYFVGQTEYSAWAVTTSQGIIVIDTIFDYSVEDEIVGGLKKLGLNPADIKYAIVSHGHSDHSGGAKYLQDHFGTRIILSAADWDLLERNTGTAARPRRDMVATDGQKLTLGDTTLTLYLTPGHTLGTISTLIPVKDGGRNHIAAAWGGTAFNFTRTRENFETYINSEQRFSEIVGRVGADVVLSNHTNYDGSRTKLPAMANRRPSEPHPYVVGNDSVRRYLKVAEECARSELVRLK